MAITTTGWDGTGVAHTNSCRINISIGDTLTEFKSAVEAFITSHSWEVYDATAGTNAICYRRAFLPDSISQIGYGYIVLDYNTSGFLILKCYESWNNTTHVGTNLATNSGTTTLYNQRIPTNTTDVFDASGWLKVQSKFGLFLLGNNGTNTGTTGDSGPTFVVELSRTCPEDLVSEGYTKLIWGCTYSLFSVSGGVGDPPLSSPRTRSTTGNGGRVGVFTDLGAGGWVGESGSTHLLPNARIIPSFADNRTGKLRYSNLRVEGNNGGLAQTESLGTCLDMILFTQGQGVSGVDDITFTAVDDTDYGGAAFISHDGIVHTWWVLGGSAGRLAVRK